MAEVENNFNECWEKYDKEEAGEIGADDIKKVATDIKAKVTGKEEAEINEEPFDEAFEGVEKSEEGTVTKDAAKAFIIKIYSSL